MQLSVISPVVSHLSVLLVAVAAAIVGTSRLGRPFTDEEKRHFDALLREHAYSDARLVALRFAFRLTNAIGRAQELMSRVDVRLLRAGWDPEQAALASRLCKLTWGEWTRTEDDNAKHRPAAGSRNELEAAEGTSIPSIEVPIIEEEATVMLTKTVVRLNALREMFESAGDDVNRAWLDAAGAAGGKPDVQKLAHATGRDVQDFDDAEKRRRRAVLKLLGEEHKVKFEEEAR